MYAQNTQNTYGWVAQLIHWSMAIAIVGLFALGLWMTSLTYYDEWYTRGPYIHEGVGIFIAALLVFRLIWRALNSKPNDDHLRPVERLGALMAHWSMYALMAVVMVSGYLISTSDGRSIDVFGWFSVPAVYASKGFEAIAGDLHYYLSFVLIGIAVIHTTAALKHHVIDKDPTLERMLPFPPKKDQN